MDASVVEQSRVSRCRLSKDDRQDACPTQASTVAESIGRCAN